MLSWTRATLLLVLVTVMLPVPWARSQDRAMGDRLDRLERQLSILQREINHIISVNAGPGSAVDVERRIEGLEEKVGDLIGRSKTQ